MKKTLSIIAALCALVSVCSCDEWLEATSSTRIPADKLFQTRSGFYDALSGIYITMGDSYSYGGTMTYALSDLTCYPYVYQSNSLKKAIQNHQYSHYSLKRSILNTWAQQYECIANVNLALSMLDKHQEAVTDPNEYKLIQGELLALRAYLHLDLMRLFGICNITADNASKLTIPYVTKYDKEPTSQLSYEMTCELLMADIDKALECLGESDPLAGNISQEDFDSFNQEGYWTNRRKHLNYISVLGLKARLYQWMGDSANAAVFARNAIDASAAKSYTTWSDPEGFVSSVGSSYYKDNTFSTEHLFSLEITNLAESALTTIAATYSAAEGYIIPATLVDDILYKRIDPVTGSLAGSEDVRGPLYMFTYSAFGYSCIKLMSQAGSPSYNIFPMMRISEMYYIIAENQIALGDNKSALSTLDEVRRHRGISDEFPQSADAEHELMLEYYREFILEGQLVYWLKHKEVESSIYSAFVLDAGDLILPYPDEEINYGRIQEL